ncbi:MAG TPA: hypothetical protein ENK48_08130 [Gammaproteobacteria bacterium]|nr:hypothetical protein [Gammaproteobacteria bacterium]
MAERQSRPIRISNSNGQHTEGTLNYSVYTPRERMLRGAKALGICWGLAVLSIPLIGAHWVLVPGFLIAGPVVGYRRYHSTESMESAVGECPTCHQQVTIPLEAGDRLPKWTYCPANNDPIQLTEEA